MLPQRLMVLLGVSEEAELPVEHPVMGEQPVVLLAVVSEAACHL